VDGLRIGLIGCGRHGAGLLLGVLGRIPGAQVVALVDINPLALADASQRVPGAACFGSASALLEQTQLDGVVIATSNLSHVEIARQAFARGLHVYLEKPVGVTTTEARALIADWRSSGQLGMIGFNYRRNPFFCQMQAAIAGGLIGKPLAVQSVFCNSSLRPIPEWKKHIESGGGACLDLGIHHVDLITHLLGARVEQVTASFSTLRSTADSASLELRLSNGAVAQIFVSFHALRQDRIEVIGSQGALAVDRYQSLNVQHYPAEVEYGPLKRLGGRVAALLRAPDLLRRLRYPTREASYEATLRVFVESVLSGGKPHPEPDLLAGFRALQVIEAAVESARSGQPVAVADDLP